MNIFDGTKVDLSNASAEDLILKMFYDDLLACPRIKYFMNMFRGFKDKVKELG